MFRSGAGHIPAKTPTKAPMATPSKAHHRRRSHPDGAKVTNAPPTLSSKLSSSLPPHLGQKHRPAKQTHHPQWWYYIKRIFSQSSLRLLFVCGLVLWTTLLLAPGFFQFDSKNHHGLANTNVSIHMPSGMFDHTLFVNTFKYPTQKHPIMVHVVTTASFYDTRRLTESVWFYQPQAVRLTLRARSHDFIPGVINAATRNGYKLRHRRTMTRHMAEHVDKNQRLLSTYTDDIDLSDDISASNATCNVRNVYNNGPSPTLGQNHCTIVIEVRLENGLWNDNNFHWLARAMDTNAYIDTPRGRFETNGWCVLLMDRWTGERADHLVGIESKTPKQRQMHIRNIANTGWPAYFYPSILHNFYLDKRDACT